MSILVIVEHDNSAVNAATLNTVAAAQAIGGDIDALVSGHNCSKSAEAAAAIEGISKVIVSDAAENANGLAENIAPLIAGMADSYSHILAPATTYGKNILPRVAALSDTAQISDIIAVIDKDTFQRPIYAGNALATVCGQAMRLKSSQSAARPLKRLQTREAQQQLNKLMQPVMPACLLLRSLSCQSQSAQI